MNNSTRTEFGSDAKPVVLFLCTYNSARSQMAEAWFRHLTSERYTLASAGLIPHHVHPTAMQVMQEVGVSLDGQWSKSVSEFLGRVAVRHIFVVCESFEKDCPRLWPLDGQIHYWPFGDPFTLMETSLVECLLKFPSSRWYFVDRQDIVRV